MPRIPREIIINGLDPEQTYIIKILPYRASSADPSSGLLAFYKFDGGLSDASGNGNNWGGNGSPTYGTGVAGRCIELVDPNFLSRSTPFFAGATGGEGDQYQPGTMAFSAKLSRLPTEGEVQAYLYRSQYFDSDSDGTSLAVDNTGKVLAVAQGGGIGGPSVGAVSAATWFHVAVTFSDVSPFAGKLYLNGSLDSSFDYLLRTLADDSIYFPASSGNNPAGLTVSLDNVGFWDRVLTAEEIASVAAGWTP